MLIYPKYRNRDDDANVVYVGEDLDHNNNNNTKEDAGIKLHCFDSH